MSDVLDARISAVWGHAPPGYFRPSEIVSEALFEVRTAPWRNQHAPCSLVEPRPCFPEKAWLCEASPVRAAHAH